MREQHTIPRLQYIKVSFSTNGEKIKKVHKYNLPVKDIRPLRMKEKE